MGSPAGYCALGDCKKALVCTNILVLVAQMNDLAKCYFHRFKVGGPGNEATSLLDSPRLGGGIIEDAAYLVEIDYRNDCSCMIDINSKKRLSGGHKSVQSFF